MAKLQKKVTDVERFKEHVALLTATIIADNLLVYSELDTVNPRDANRLANAVKLALMLIGEVDRQVDRQLETTGYELGL